MVFQYLCLSYPLGDSRASVLCFQDSIGLLLDAVKTSNEELAQTWKKSEQWATIEQLCSKLLIMREGTDLSSPVVQSFR